MRLNEYQMLAAKHAVYPTIGHPIVYPALGLAGEAGETLEKIKKVFRDNNGNFDIALSREIVKELGDTLWYLSEIARSLCYTLEDVAQANLDKCDSRAERGVLNGNGDNR